MEQESRKGRRMSRLSEAEEYKKASEDSVALVGLTENIDLITKTNIAVITDTALQCLVLLAEIADMLERDAERSEDASKAD
jgi:hypothetical protein